jgi:hypothetical protein
MGFHWSLAFQRYGPVWRRGRKMLHGHIHIGVSHVHHPTQIISARRLARELLSAKQEKEVLPHLVRTNFGQFALKMIYGLDIKDPQHEYMTVTDNVIEALSESGLPGRFFVDFIPICEYNPLVR